MKELAANTEERKNQVKRVIQNKEKDEIMKEMYAIASKTDTKENVFKGLLVKYLTIEKDLCQAIKKRDDILKEIELGLGKLAEEKHAAASKTNERLMV